MRRHNLTPALIFLVFLAFYGLTSRGGLQVSDEVAVLATSVALATEGNLAIDELQWLQDAVGIGQKGPDGHLYAKYFPGNVLSAALIYKLAERQNDQPFVWNSKALAPSDSGARLAMRLNAIFGALAMTWLFLLLSQYFSLQTTVVTLILVGVCSDWWYQSRGFLSEVGASAFMLGSLYFATRNRPYYSSSALALSVLFRPLNLLGLPVWALSVWRTDRKAAWSVLPIFASLLVLAAYNFLRFASPFDFGYANEAFGSSIFAGLYGILLSPGRSLFLYSPILLLALPGIALLYQKEKSLAAVCSITILAYTLTIATWHRWDGGWTWGSRLLTPIVPIIGILIAPVIERMWSKRWLFALVTFLAIVGFGVQIVALAKDPLQVMIVNVANGSIKYDETLYTIHNSWLAMQSRSLSRWQPCDIDAEALRSLFKPCQP